MSPKVPFLVLGYLMISLGHSTASLWLMESWGLFPFSQVQGAWPHDLAWTGDPAWSVACVPCLPSANITTCLQWGLFLWPRSQNTKSGLGSRSEVSSLRIQNVNKKPFWQATETWGLLTTVQLTKTCVIGLVWFIGPNCYL